MGLIAGRTAQQYNQRKKRKGAVEKIDAKRQSRWTESISVDSRPFIERNKKTILALAKGSGVQYGEGEIELRRAQSIYNAILDHENRGIDPK